MKKIYVLVALNLLLVSYAKSQCSVQITHVNVLCNGQCNGSANAVPLGVPPYQYLWQPGSMTTQNITGLCAGTYTVNVLDNTSCASSATVVITQPVALSSTTTHINPTCNGSCNGSASAFPGGGTSPYTHKWNTSPVQTSATATGLCAGTFVDTITDNNGCKTIATVGLTQPTALAVNVNCSSVSCNGGSNGTSVASASGGTPSYTYSWNTSPAQTTATASGLSAGAYSCRVTDANGCSMTSSCTVNQPAVLAVTGSSTNASCSSCADGTATASSSGGTSPYTFLWAPGGQTTGTATGLNAGTYTICVTDAHSCSTCIPVSVNFTTGINDHSLSTDFTIYPNPANDAVTLEMNTDGSAQVRISVLNILGETVFSEEEHAAAHFRKDLSVLNYGPGIYFIRIQNGSHSWSQKLMVK